MKHQACTSRNIGHGVLAGFISGVVFDFLMLKFNFLNEIGPMIGMYSLTAGFIIHLILSIFMGVLFALVFFRLAHSLLHSTIWGTLYGIIWWFLGPLTILPGIMENPLGSAWNLVTMQKALPSLYGHLVFGFLLGLVYGWLRTRKKKRKK